MLKHLGNTSITSGVLQTLTLSNGVSFVTLTAPPTGIYILALPPDLGTSGQVLTTNGAGQTSWTTVSGGGGGSVTSVAATVPTFLQVTGSPITSFGSLDITYSGIPLPTTSGGTGLTTIGTANQVLTSNGSSLVWQPSYITAVSPNFEVTSGVLELSNTVITVLDMLAGSEIAIIPPAFLTVTGSPVTIIEGGAFTLSLSGTIQVNSQGTALPITSGGTGLTAIGANDTLLFSNGTAASWISSSGIGTSYLSYL